MWTTPRSPAHSTYAFMRTNGNPAVQQYCSTHTFLMLVCSSFIWSDSRRTVTCFGYEFGETLTTLFCSRQATSRGESRYSSSHPFSSAVATDVWWWLDMRSGSILSARHDNTIECRDRVWAQCCHHCKNSVQCVTTISCNALSSENFHVVFLNGSIEREADFVYSETKSGPKQNIGLSGLGGRYLKYYFAP